VGWSFISAKSSQRGKKADDGVGKEEGRSGGLGRGSRDKSERDVVAKTGALVRLKIAFPNI